MPKSPPVFRPPGWREREPWERPQLYQDKRLRGRAAMRARAEMLVREPYCRKCLEQGKKVLAEWRKEKAAQEEIRQAQEALEAEEIANLMEGLSHAEIVSRLSRPVGAES